MLAAVESGDAKELAELMRQDPGFKVNMDHTGQGHTLLHYACDGDSKSAVIPLLLAHPDIDVNVKSKGGYTPFSYACYFGRPSCVREMLKDSRVKVNEPNNDGETPLGGLLTAAALTPSSSGFRLEGRWISGNQGKGRRMSLGGQKRKASQKWRPCWRDPRRIR